MKRPTILHPDGGIRKPFGNKICRRPLFSFNYPYGLRARLDLFVSELGYL